MLIPWLSKNTKLIFPGEPISIRALKRLVTERHGVEAQNGIDIKSIVDHPGETGGKTGKKIAIIGSGPSSLACTHDLAMFGHLVTVFEAEKVLGGMLYLGIPEYRLPKQLLQQEIDFIKDHGVEMRSFWQCR